jgi:TonB family protein
MRKITSLTPAVKKHISILALITFMITADGQNINYDVHTPYSRSVKKEVLTEAKTLGDIISHYPVNWITSYDSVRLVVKKENKIQSLKGKNDILSREQQDLLNTAELFDNVEIHVWYKFKEPYFKETEKNHMYVRLTVAPETEAEYTGGRQQMMKYLKEQAIDKIDTAGKVTWTVKIKFTINEDGDINSAKLIGSSGNKKTDRILLEAINNMPKWKPAKTSDGKKIRQEFEFTAGKGQGC